MRVLGVRVSGSRGIGIAPVTGKMPVPQISPLKCQHYIHDYRLPITDYRLPHPQLWQTYA